MLWEESKLARSRLSRNALWRVEQEIRSHNPVVLNLSRLVDHFVYFVSLHGPILKYVFLTCSKLTLYSHLLVSIWRNLKTEYLKIKFCSSDIGTNFWSELFVFTLHRGNNLPGIAKSYKNAINVINRISAASAARRQIARLAQLSS